MDWRGCGRKRKGWMEGKMGENKQNTVERRKNKIGKGQNEVEKRLGGDQKGEK